MKKLFIGIGAAVLLGLAALAAGNGKGHDRVLELGGPVVMEADVTAQQAVGTVVIANGITYFNNVLNGNIAFVLFYTLEPGHVYQVDGTSDAISYQPLYTISTLNQTQDVSLNYSVSMSQCSFGLWPRITEIQ